MVGASRMAYTFGDVVSNILCAVEMTDPRPTRAQLLSLPGPTTGENGRAMQMLVDQGMIFEEEGRYYLTTRGERVVSDMLGELRLSSGWENDSRVRRN